MMYFILFDMKPVIPDHKKSLKIPRG